MHVVTCACRGFEAAKSRFDPQKNCRLGMSILQLIFRCLGSQVSPVGETRSWAARSPLFAQNTRSGWGGGGGIIWRTQNCLFVAPPESTNQPHKYECCQIAKARNLLPPFPLTTINTAGWTSTVLHILHRIARRSSPIWPSARFTLSILDAWFPFWGYGGGLHGLRG